MLSPASSYGPLRIARSRGSSRALSLAVSSRSCLSRRAGGSSSRTAGSSSPTCPWTISSRSSSTSRTRLWSARIARCSRSSSAGMRTCEKGGAWVLERNGPELVPALYLAPPAGVAPGAAPGRLSQRRRGVYPLRRGGLARTSARAAPSRSPPRPTSSLESSRGRLGEDERPSEERLDAARRDVEPRGRRDRHRRARSVREAVELARRRNAGRRSSRPLARFRRRPAAASGWVGLESVEELADPRSCGVELASDGDAPSEGMCASTRRAPASRERDPRRPVAGMPISNLAGATSEVDHTDRPTRLGQKRDRTLPGETALVLGADHDDRRLRRTGEEVDELVGVVACRPGAVTTVSSSSTRAARARCAKRSATSASPSSLRSPIRPRR